MEDFIISETSNIFLKGIKRYQEKYKVEFKQIFLLLYLKNEEDVGYQVYVDGEYKEDVTIKDILGIKFIDMKGYSVIAPPYIHKFLSEFVNELGTKAIDVSVILNNDEDDVIFFLNKNGDFVREVFIKDLIKSKTE